LRRGCLDQVAYASQAEAVASLLQLKQAKAYVDSVTGKHRHTYKCQRCGKWHVGYAPIRIRKLYG
jgi:hypothetical protein